MVGLAADDVEAFLQVTFAIYLFTLNVSYLIFPVCGGEVRYLECNGHPANKVHGAHRFGAKCAGDLIEHEERKRDLFVRKALDITWHK